MKNSYRYYKNVDCKYFPCHDVDEASSFNCMFCYCPLYLIEKCGGNYQKIDGIKDCSYCLIPHKVKGYEYINKKLSEVVFSSDK